MALKITLPYDNCQTSDIESVEANAECLITVKELEAVQKHWLRVNRISKQFKIISQKTGIDMHRLTEVNKSAWAG